MIHRTLDFVVMTPDSERLNKYNVKAWISSSWQTANGRRQKHAA
jgi:hypothetical protein